MGVGLGAVTYHDLEDESLRTVVLEEDICEGGDLNDLLRASNDVGERAVNLYFVERYQCIFAGGIDVGQGIAGISGGIPGAPYARGTPRSGVAIATSVLLSEPDRMGLVLAHEVGHFLGLYHSMEDNTFGGPEIYDVIADTVNDPNEAQDNLMFYRADESTQLSPGQAAVVRGNPLVLP